MKSACGTCEPGALTLNTRVALVCGFFLMFCFCFVACWFLMERYYKTFKNLPFPVKADNCSRVNSTIHSILVVPTLLIGVLTTSWDEETKQPTSSVAFLQTILCITTAYFLCDTTLMVLYRVPLWGVYLTHHILAVTPYIIYFFVSPCGYGLLLLSCFMLVEFSNFSLNAQSWLEQNGSANTKTYAFCFYATFVGWIACRLINPYLMVYYAHAAIFPSIPKEQQWCFIPALVCGYLIVLFCTCVFIFVHCAALRKRWQSTDSLLAVAPHAKDDLIRCTEEGGSAANDDSARQMRTNSGDNSEVNNDSKLSNNNGNNTTYQGVTIEKGGDDKKEEAHNHAPYEGMESPTRAMALEAERTFEHLAHAVRERASSIVGGVAGGPKRRSPPSRSNSNEEPLDSPHVRE